MIKIISILIVLCISSLSGAEEIPTFAFDKDGKIIENKVFKIIRLSEKPHEVYQIQFLEDFAGGATIWQGREGEKDFYITVEYEKGANHKYPFSELRD